jgi:hypothetical protein
MNVPEASVAHRIHNDLISGYFIWTGRVDSQLPV